MVSSAMKYPEVCHEGIRNLWNVKKVLNVSRATQPFFFQVHLGNTSQFFESTFIDTLPETNISPEKAILKMIFLLKRWDMLVPWRVLFQKVMG